MSLKTPTRKEIALFPVTTALLCLAAFQVAGAAATETRLVLQALLTFVTVNETLYYFLVSNYVFQIPTPEPKPEEPQDEAPEGFKRFVRVNGKIMTFEQVTTVPKISKERSMYVTLWRWHENGRPLNLTEAYWVQHKKFFSQKEFIAIMKRGDRASVFYRTSALRNATRDVLDWQRVRAIAYGGPLPR